MLDVRITPEADVQILEIHDWWRANRPAAPTLFVDELGAALEMIAHAPSIGRPYRQSPIPDTRRLPLQATRYHVYYTANPGHATILAVWHGRRGVGPPLRA